MSATTVLIIGFSLIILIILCTLFLCGVSMFVTWMHRKNWERIGKDD